MNLRLSVFAALALSGAPHAVRAYLALDAYGTSLAIPTLELAYDQNQNHAGGLPPVVEDGGHTLRSVGNRWSAYQLPSPLEVYDDTVLELTFRLDEDTVDGFQAVCLDLDREITGTNGRCFGLATSQGWLDGPSKIVNVAATTAAGQQSANHSIPIGHWFTGPVDYLAYIQDSDGTNKTKGDSRISDLRLVRREPAKLSVEVGGTPQELENGQLSYTYKGRTQDTNDWLVRVSEDGSSVQVDGNQWKAFPLNAPYTVTHLTTIELDVVVDEPGDFHAICLDEDLDAATAEEPCVSFMTPVDNTVHMLTTELAEGVPERLSIPYGQMMGLYAGDIRTANYLAFVQDSDVADKRGGRSTYANITIYEAERTDIVFEVYGENVTVPNVQMPFTSSGSGGTSATYKQDSYDHVMSVSPDGRAVTAHGNSWKRFKLDVPFEVTAATMLRFDFSVAQQAEVHRLCLLGDSNNAQDGRKDCFGNSGFDLTSSNGGAEKIDPWVTDGESATGIEVWLGGYFTGPVLYLAFSIDNDKVYFPSKAEGESTWSNIQIYNLPSLNLGIDGTNRAIANNQKSYDQSQDTTPIGEHLAVVSEDGSSVTVHGNTWRAFPIEPAIPAADLGDFVVSFEYSYAEQGEFHVVCFEDNREWGDYDDPKDNGYDPTRCILLNDFDNIRHNLVYGYQPGPGETHRYVVNLSKVLDRFYELKYLVILLDNDAGDKSGGEMTLSNFHITTSLTSCLKDISYDFTLSDCTAENFLAGVKAQMILSSCPGGEDADPLLELMALYDATTEMDVYREIEFTCNSAYEAHQYDFAATISDEAQLVREFIDGGTVLNYERDAEGGSLTKDGAGIALAEQVAADSLLTWPEHHALDRCDAGAAMCCWVDSRGDAALEDNSDVCYVDMKASRRTARVADGWSIYGEGAIDGPVRCRGFAWGTDAGSTADALKGNALFRVGFLDGLYRDLRGNVEQVPGAPMCGCVDRMPVVTEAACTRVSDDASTVDVSHRPGIGAFRGTFNMGTIEYADCGVGLAEYYKTLVGADSHLADYMDTRVVGAGGCHDAINDFLSKKGLVKSG